MPSQFLLSTCRKWQSNDSIVDTGQEWNRKLYVMWKEDVWPTPDLPNISIMDWNGAALYLQQHTQVCQPPERNT